MYVTGNAELMEIISTVSLGSPDTMSGEDYIFSPMAASRAPPAKLLVRAFSEGTGEEWTSSYMTRASKPCRQMIVCGTTHMYRR
jgi:hypothetical protein